MAMTGGVAKLVASGTPSGWPGPINLYAYYIIKPYNIANNSTPISLGMYVTTPDGWYFGPWTDYGSYIGSATSGSNCKVFDGSCPANTQKLRWLAENLEVTVAHDSDGSKTATIYWKWGINSAWSGLVLPSGSFTVKLPTIPRTSDVSVSATSVQMGSKLTINIDRKASSFKHTLSYSFAGVTGDIATGVDTSYGWTVPDLVSLIPGKTSGVCTITCKTYSGNSLVGSDTVKVTLTIPAKSSPTTSASSVQMGKTMKIQTNRRSSAFTHILLYEIGSTSGIIAEEVGAEINWAPPKSLASYTGNKVSATCTITCETWSGDLLVGSSDISVTLTVPDPTVPKLAVTSVQLGSAVSISLPREVSAYEHDLSYSLKADSGNFAAISGTIENNIGTVFAWSVPLSLAASIPNDTGGTLTISCKTRFKGSTTVVGTKSVSVAATVPDNPLTQPKFTMALTPVNSLPSAFNGVYVAGKSAVKVEYTASSAYANIAAYNTEANGSSGKTNPYTSPVYVNSGKQTITGKVTDSRGYSTTKTAEIEVIPYSRPRIIPGEGKTNIVCKRCNSDGTIDPGGVYLLIQMGRGYSKVASGGVQKNYCALRYRYKLDAAGEESYSEPVTLLEKNAVSDYVSVVLGGIVSSNTTAYTIELIAEDDVGEKDTVPIVVPTAFVTFHVPIGGHGFTLGGYHDPAKYDVFDCWFGAEFHSTVSVEEFLHFAATNGELQVGIETDSEGETLSINLRSGENLFKLQFSSGGIRYMKNETVLWTK